MTGAMAPDLGVLMCARQVIYDDPTHVVRGGEPTIHAPAPLTLASLRALLPAGGDLSA